MEKFLLKASGEEVGVEKGGRRDQATDVDTVGGLEWESCSQMIALFLARQWPEEQAS